MKDLHKKLTEAIIEALDEMFEEIESGHLGIPADRMTNPPDEEAKYKPKDWIRIRYNLPGSINVEEMATKQIKEVERGLHLGFLFTDGTSCISTKLNAIRPATDDEVREYLVAEAKRRGFKKGVKIDANPIRTFVAEFDPSNTKQTFFLKDGPSDLVRFNMTLCQRGGVIYKGDTGEWAKVVEEEKEDKPKIWYVVNELPLPSWAKLQALNDIEDRYNKGIAVPDTQSLSGAFAWRDSNSGEPFWRAISREEYGHLPHPEKWLIKEQLRPKTFKVGQWVEIHTNAEGSTHEIGDVGRIVEVQKYSNRVEVPGRENDANFHSSECLIEANPSQIRDALITEASRRCLFNARVDIQHLHQFGKYPIFDTSYSSTSIYSPVDDSLTVKLSTGLGKVVIYKEGKWATKVTESITDTIQTDKGCVICVLSTGDVKINEAKISFEELAYIYDRAMANHIFK